MRKLFSQKRGVSLLVILSCLIYLGGFLFADKGPKMKFKEESWNFGKVKQGDILTHVFMFKNIGDQNLAIKNVRTSCGCAAALVSDKNLAPGKTGEIKVTFNTRGYAGKSTKYVYVESNDPSQLRKQLTVSADIDVPPQPKIELDRFSVDLGLFLEEEEIQARTKIKNKGELELRVNCSHRNASFFSDGKKISFPFKIAAGKEREIDIKMPPNKKRGLMREYILLKSNDPMRPSLSLYLSGYVITKKQLKELFRKYKNILE